MDEKNKNFGEWKFSDFRLGLVRVENFPAQEKKTIAGAATSARTPSPLAAREQSAAQGGRRDVVAIDSDANRKVMEFTVYFSLGLAKPH